MKTCSTCGEAKRPECFWKDKNKADGLMSACFDCRKASRGLLPWPDRFWARVRKSPGCWEWTGHKRTGYGQISRANKPIAAHRLSLELTTGAPVPAGAVVLHKCDNRGCVRPDHLEVGTQADNIRDAAAKGRVCHGVRHPHAKLNPSAVIEIRQMRTTGASWRVIAEAFGVSLMTAKNAARGKTWRRVGQCAEWRGRDE